eukprot:TRINITY_DN18992_c0_g1_i1.p1 TRINITY_DN18992_c0_g1~~TRINITY_DN18992_c0_g1_i1.p1  ORF type:complete len:770 (-),score=63.55 TRINITY_DN18992_c0_g1_i1:39-2348(-)
MAIASSDTFFCHEVGEPGSLAWRATFVTQKGEVQQQISPWDDIPAFFTPLGDSNNRDLINCICKTPAGMWTRVEIAEEEAHHPLRICRTYQKSTEPGVGAVETPLHYCDNAPWNINFIPQTATQYLEPTSNVSATSPGSVESSPRKSMMPKTRWEPKEVLDIGAQTPRHVGEVYSVKPLCSFLVVANGELSWKIIGIAATDPMAEVLHDVPDIKKWLPGCVEQIRDWLRICNCSHKGVKESAFLNDGEVANVDATSVTILRSHVRWQNRHHATLAAPPPPADASCSCASTPRTPATRCSGHPVPDLCLPGATSAFPAVGGSSVLAPSLSLTSRDSSSPSNNIPLSNPRSSSLFDIKSVLTSSDDSRSRTSFPGGRGGSPGISMSQASRVNSLPTLLSADQESPLGSARMSPSANPGALPEGQKHSNSLSDDSTGSTFNDDATLLSPGGDREVENLQKATRSASEQNLSKMPPATSSPSSLRPPIPPADSPGAKQTALQRVRQPEQLQHKDSSKSHHQSALGSHKKHSGSLHDKHSAHESHKHDSHKHDTHKRDSHKHDSHKKFFDFFHHHHSSHEHKDHHETHRKFLDFFHHHHHHGSDSGSEHGSDHHDHHRKFLDFFHHHHRHHDSEHGSEHGSDHHHETHRKFLDFFNHHHSHENDPDFHETRHKFLDYFYHHHTSHHHDSHNHKSGHETPSDKSSDHDDSSHSGSQRKAPRKSSEFFHHDDKHSHGSSHSHHSKKLLGMFRHHSHSHHDDKLDSDSHRSGHSGRH